MKLYFVRHGQTQYNREARFQGSVNIPLDEEGKKQAEDTGRRFEESFRKGEHIDAVYTSPLTRARTTAEIVSSHIGTAPKEEAGLEEINMGEWEGKTYGQVVEEYKAPSGVPLFMQIKDDPLNYHMPGGETAAQIDQRVMSSLDRIMQSHLPEENIMIVTHGCPIAVVLCHVLGQGVGNIMKYLGTHNASVTVVEVGEDRNINNAKVLLMDDISHLNGNNPH